MNHIVVWDSHNLVKSDQPFKDCIDSNYQPYRIGAFEYHNSHFLHRKF